MLDAETPSVNLRVNALGRMIFDKTYAQTPDGVHAVDVPDGLGPLLSHLRNGMYHSGVGTWFTMQMMVELPARMTVDFGGDAEPMFGDRPPPASSYADELRLYPRDPEHVPTWLLARLNQTSSAAPPRKDSPFAE